MLGAGRREAGRRGREQEAARAQGLAHPAHQAAARQELVRRLFG